MRDFITETVLKRDVFSETRKGAFADAPDRPVIRRIVTASPWWTRPLAWILAGREIAALKTTTKIDGAPQLIATDRNGLYRAWIEGTPLHLARPENAAWYRDAARLLRDLRGAGLTHNDLAKPQNWLVTLDGRASVIDFQLASRHRRRGVFYRIMAYEDRRHLVKQKRAFAPHLLTHTEKRILARRSLPSRIWRTSGKKIYNAITRGVFRWSDREGAGRRLEHEAPAIRAALLAHPGVRDVAIVVYPLPRKGVGLYAFCEAGPGVSPVDLAAQQRNHGAAGAADIIQIVRALPRRPDGGCRDDILQLIAVNQVTALEAVIASDPEIAAIAKSIASERLNFSDRRLSGRPA